MFVFFFHQFVGQAGVDENEAITFTMTQTTEQPRRRRQQNKAKWQKMGRKKKKKRHRELMEMHRQTNWYGKMYVNEVALCFQKRSKFKKTFHCHCIPNMEKLDIPYIHEGIQQHNTKNVCLNFDFEIYLLLVLRLNIGCWYGSNG